MSGPERGSVSLLLLGLAGLALVLAAGMASIAVAIAAHRDARTAADAAALAAAPVTFRPFGAGAGPAEEAARFAGANGAALVRCSCRINRSWHARTVAVEVARTVPFPPFGSLTVRAIGRAEFDPAALLIRRVIR